MLIQRRFSAVAVMTIVTALTLSAPVEATCENSCEITATKAVIEPAIDCLQASSVTDSCNCGVGLDVYNKCGAEFSAVGFVFDTCWYPQTSGGTIYADDHSHVPPNYWCGTEISLSSVGSTSYEYHLEQSGTNYKITFQANVKGFDHSHCACSTVGRSTKQGKGALSASLGALALVLGLRRRKQSRKGPPLNQARTLQVSHRNGRGTHTG